MLCGGVCRFVGNLKRKTTVPALVGSPPFLPLRGKTLISNCGAVNASKADTLSWMAHAGLRERGGMFGRLRAGAQADGNKGNLAATCFAERTALATGGAGRTNPAAGGGDQEGRWSGYRESHHQIAKAMAVKTAVAAAERNNESAANLIQSVTVHTISGWPHCRVRQFSRYFNCHAMAFLRSTPSQFVIGALAPAMRRVPSLPKMP